MIKHTRLLGYLCSQLCSRLLLTLGVNHSAYCMKHTSWLVGLFSRLLPSSESVSVIEKRVHLINIRKWFVSQTPLIAFWNEKVCCCYFVLQHMWALAEHKIKWKISSQRGFIFQCWVYSPTLDSSALVQNNCWGIHPLFLFSFFFLFCPINREKRTHNRES